MNFSQIDIDETHIRLTTDLESNNLKKYIFNIRRDLKDYILRNNDFLLSLNPIKISDDGLSEIIFKMYTASNICDVGPMACVAGTISELSLDYLIRNNSKYSIVENGGDISLINNKRTLCGIYSNNAILGNNIAFEIKPRRNPLAICTSSGKIGHSISFGQSDSVTVIGKSCSICDGLATKIANSVVGETSEDKVVNAVECGERFYEFFDGVLIVCDGNVATLGKLPKIVETNEFHVDV